MNALVFSRVALWLASSLLAPLISQSAKKLLVQGMHWYCQTGTTDFQELRVDVNELRQLPDLEGNPNLEVFSASQNLLEELDKSWSFTEYARGIPDGRIGIVIVP